MPSLLLGFTNNFDDEWIFIVDFQRTTNDFLTSPRVQTTAAGTAVNGLPHRYHLYCTGKKENNEAQTNMVSNNDFGTHSQLFNPSQYESNSCNFCNVVQVRCLYLYQSTHGLPRRQYLYKYSSTCSVLELVPCTISTSTCA